MAGAARGPEFDPRYDARYQRGWAPGESDDPEPDDPAAPEDPAALADRADPPTDPVMASPVPDLAASGPVAAPAPWNDPHPGPEAEPEPLAVDASEPVPSITPSPSPADVEGRRDAARIIRIALGVSWAIAIAATLVGAGLIWSLIAVEDPFGIPAGGEVELMIRTLAQFVAPSLLSTGLLGMVALLVVDGLRRARRICAPIAERAGGAS
ncbi:hypothetical protein BCL57_000740 [Agromyces flavus]|uniref:Uncharacterized protein n=1 Tax=Agromyces flavus TaxID=589382 RepID=A0A1H1Y7F8_9MICO|nr:hypothetical protein [Agromyces flavus]MCP2366598.1 hypothetical protein [Agromyces flavus]GGI44996.1 hypothetical protein GCM10010932_07410 [Agromyces flavus]SDT17149.1 hypothetical protein SAMN04489721_2673 [Agromyces flavus]